jgi:protein gp37
MADRLTFIRLFNQKAEEFCKDLVSTFPEVNEFKQLKSAMLLLKNLDEKKPREIFNNFMTQQFREKVSTRDESFFMNEVHNHVVHVDGIDTSQWENIVNLLRTLWVGLSVENKESIWKYFQVLIAVCDKCAV